MQQRGYQLPFKFTVVIGGPASPSCYHYLPPYLDHEDPDTFGKQCCTKPVSESGTILSLLQEPLLFNFQPLPPKITNHLTKTARLLSSRFTEIILSPLNHMASLSFTPSPVLRPISGRRCGVQFCKFSIKASSSETSANVVSTKDDAKPPFAISAPPNFKAPEPKRFTIRPDKILDILGASLALVFRLGTGVFVDGYSASFVGKEEIPSNQYALELAGFKVKEVSKLGPRPEKPIEIYEFESCPFCRKVREIVSVLDLDVLYYPCPRNGPNFRPKVGEMGGKKQFPYMVDPNTGVSMYESDDIIKYLVGKYGNGNVPFTLSLGLLTTLTEGFAMIGRMGRGSSYIPSKMPPKPLEVWAYEGSPFCKVVREVLVELELPHIIRSCGRGSPKRQVLYEKVGHFQVPYIEDPNTGVSMFESAEIVEYLKATYAV